MSDKTGLELTFNRKRLILKIVASIHLRYIAILVVLVLLSGAGGYLLGSRTVLPSATSQQPFALATNTVKTSPLFQNQTASVYGKITKTTDTILTITDKNGRTEEFAISPKFMVYKALNGVRQATASSQISSIDPEKNASIALEVIDGKYQVVSVTYLPETPLPPTR